MVSSIIKKMFKQNSAAVSVVALARQRNEHGF